MSSDGRRAQRQRRKARGFSVRVLAVVAVLGVVALAGGVVTTLQGPRVTSVQSDVAAAVSSSGSRLIFETTQSLKKVDAAQVTVTPAAKFTVDTSGRSVGIRFTDPLWDQTTYSIRIDRLAGLGGGPTSTVEESFSTPKLHSYVLERSSGGDKIYRVGLDGDNEPVFENEHIEDFRATAAHLVVSTLKDGVSHLIVTRTDGSGPQELALPGKGVVTNLQSAERGNTIGYTFTDADISASGGRESLLFTGSTADPAAKPAEIKVTGADPRVEDWRFVPGTDTILMLTFDGALSLVSSAGAPPVELGNAAGIDDISGTTAYIERIDGPAVIDLASAKEKAPPPTPAELGQTGSVLALSDGSTLRALTPFDGMTPLATAVTRVEAAGKTSVVAQVDPADGLLQTCVSPSGRYAALVVAPDVVDNPYDGYTLPLPKKLETRIYGLDGKQITTIDGFDVAWCRKAPSL
ncbi:hypothetical protein [Microbacterium oleivorans]|uniref:Dipeptidyl aminopeptidase/acylaminoacyl-peptidase n=1 Tax=Microbacterium oleivorans TaxID=273677 RepID=A0A031FU51_9MICO|nr:hypothetical protein [Microbacterium oleivorans]EZP27827.1 Dipeptidyl aminopeptidase/acylaminoacyl-peptidase [Microbacterium oleivorans]